MIEIIMVHLGEAGRDRVFRKIHRCLNCGLVMGRDQVSANIIEIRQN